MERLLSDLNQHCHARVPAPVARLPPAGSMLYSPRASAAGPRRSPYASTLATTHFGPCAKVRTSPQRTPRLGLSIAVRAPPRVRRTPPSSTIRAARLLVLKKRARHSQTSIRQASSVTRRRVRLRGAAGPWRVSLGARRRRWASPASRARRTGSQPGPLWAPVSLDIERRRNTARSALSSRTRVNPSARSM